MFGPAKRTVLFTMFDDALSQSLSDSRKFFQLFDRGGVDIDPGRGLLIRCGCCLNRGRRLPIVHLCGRWQVFAARTFDAGNG